MGEHDRFYVVRENHIGFGVRWETSDPNWRICISIGIPFVSFVMCFMERK
jgi:hypothetical protein